ncbi:MAG TPA: Ig-like domain-containing protein, partial [Deferrisomatales bacterium]|nr:Ig-like domain-containing protein [Deferrisomatales bacterium]
TAQNTVLNVDPPGVLFNDTDADGNPLTVSAVNGAPANVGVDNTLLSGATLRVNADGSFTYTPPAGTTVIDSFTYVANDGLANSNVATVTIVVGNPNQPPVAVDDAFVTGLNKPVSGNVLVDNGNGVDFDPNATDTLAVSAVNGTPIADLTFPITLLPSGATLTLNVDGSFIYTPNINFAGTDSFTYVATDGTLDSNVATVTIKVNDSVVITSASYRARQNRWNIQGNVVPAAFDVTVSLYKTSVLAGNLIGTASVDPITGGWIFNNTGAVGAAVGETVTVIAVSSGGGEFTASFTARR